MRISLKRIEFCFIIILLISGHVFAYSIPDTAQTVCYNGTGQINCPQPEEPFFGQDANYLINRPSFTKLDAQGKELDESATDWVMVRDNITGLVWEKKTNDGSIHDKDNKYTWYDSNPLTNGGNSGTDGDDTDTEDFIDALNTNAFGGFSDWRLPSVLELRTIVSLNDYGPAIDEQYFPNCGTSNYGEYWSATTKPGTTSSVMTILFDKGRGSYSASKTSTTSTKYIRAVRGDALYNKNGAWFDNGDGTVTDLRTGLMWQKNVPNTKYSWSDALDSCETLSYAGYTDWRLPNLNELESIIDHTTDSPAIDKTIFPDAPNDAHWTSSTYAAGATNAWSVFFNYGYAYEASKTYTRLIRAVRGGQNQQEDNLVITAPTQASEWKVNQVMPITWETNGIGGNVKISLSRQGGKDGTFQTIATTENDGIFDWKITGKPSYNCVLKIELPDASKATVQGLFRIINIILSSSHLTVSEPDGSNLFTIHLTQAPSDDVTLNISSSDAGQCTALPTVVTLNSSNWDRGVSVSVIPADDGVNDGDQFCTIQTSSAQSNDLNFNGFDPADVTVLVKDIDPDFIPPFIGGYLPDTGQSKCFDDAGNAIPCPKESEDFYGQDSSYIMNPPSFTKLDEQGNPLPNSAAEWMMVRDNITGLLWEVKTNDDSIHNRSNKYTWYDGVTGTSGNGTDTMDIIDAMNAEQFGGFSDWRLPTIWELTTIMNARNRYPTIDTDYFPNCNTDEPGKYWSSTPYTPYSGKPADVGNTTSAYSLDFRSGTDYYSLKSLALYVRAVRGGTELSKDRYIINGDGTVTDTQTGLMWQYEAPDSKYTWKNALFYCENLSHAGYTDWRLPNLYELKSIIDYSKTNQYTFNPKPSIDLTYFPNTKDSTYWTSTTYAENDSSTDFQDDAWRIFFSSGYAYNYLKSSENYVRAVRAGQNRTAGNLFITSPIQGSDWSIGQTMPIIWDTRNISGNVNIFISRDGGKPESFQSIISNIPNDGHYEWTVDGSSSFNCMLKIEPVSDPLRGAIQGLFNIISFGVSPTTLKIKEPDGSANFTIQLNSQPAGNVIIGLSVSDPDECSISESSVTLDNLNWEDGVSVTVTAVDDGIKDGDQVCRILTSAAKSSDEDFNGKDPGDVNVIVQDDYPELKIESVSPSLGIVGQSLANVKVKGRGFVDGIDVKILKGSRTVQATSVVIMDTHTLMTFNIPAQSEAGQYTLKVSTGSATDVLESAISFETPETIEPYKLNKAIIVAGGGPYHGNVLWNATQQVTNLAYHALLSQGYTHDKINFLSAEPYNDVDGDGVNDVDANADSGNLMKAITEWAIDSLHPNAQLLIYMSGHGGNEAFQLNKYESVKASNLDGWIDTWHQTMTGRLIFIYDACMALNFVSKMPSSGGYGSKRIIIASTERDQRAWFMDEGKFSFSYKFWDTVFSKGMLYLSFDESKEMMKIDQSAILEMDGDGDFNDYAPELLNADIQIGRGRWAASLPPEIQSVDSNPNQLTCDQTTSTIRAHEVTSINGIQNVYARVVPPSDNIDPTEPILSLPTQKLFQWTEDQPYQADIDLFTENGTYKVVVYCMDNAGFQSLPVGSTVIRNCQGEIVMGDMDGDDDVDLTDAIIALKVLSGIHASGEIRPDYSENGDVNGNLKIGIEESVYILQYVSGLRNR